MLRGVKWQLGPGILLWPRVRHAFPDNAPPQKHGKMEFGDSYWLLSPKATNSVAGGNATGNAAKDVPTLKGDAPVKIGNMLAVKVRYRQGLASQSGSESWVGGSNPTGQALTGERIGWVLSRERG